MARLADIAEHEEDEHNQAVEPHKIPSEESERPYTDGPHSEGNVGMSSHISDLVS